MADGTPSRAPLRVLTTDGVQFLAGLSDGEAGQVGRHWNAVRHYLDTGEDHQLPQFAGAVVAGFTLETRVKVIEGHAIRGDVRFESIYDEVI